MTIQTMEWVMAEHAQIVKATAVPIVLEPVMLVLILGIGIGVLINERTLTMTECKMDDEDRAEVEELTALGFEGPTADEHNIDVFSLQLQHNTGMYLYVFVHYQTRYEVERTTISLRCKCSGNCNRSLSLTFNDDLTVGEIKQLLKLLGQEIKSDTARS